MKKRVLMALFQYNLVLLTDIFFFFGERELSHEFARKIHLLFFTLMRKDNNFEINMCNGFLQGKNIRRHSEPTQARYVSLCKERQNMKFFFVSMGPTFYNKNKKIQRKTESFDTFE